MAKKRHGFLSEAGFGYCRFKVFYGSVWFHCCRPKTHPLHGVRPARAAKPEGSE